MSKSDLGLRVPNLEQRSAPKVKREQLLFLKTKFDSPNRLCGVEFGPAKILGNCGSVHARNSE
jgi:hypothetical protein